MGCCTIVRTSAKQGKEVSLVVFGVVSGAAEKIFLESKKDLPTPDRSCDRSA